MTSYRLQILSFFWAVAIIFSANSGYGWVIDLSHQWSVLLASVCAIALLSRPHSPLLLSLSIGAFLLVIASISPEIQNHRMVLFFGGVAILWGIIRTGKESRIVPDLRWITIVVYFFAALAKFNADYLNDEVSCATIFLKGSLQLNGLGGIALPSLPGLSSLSGYWSLLVEVLLLVLLIPRRTRGWGILLGVGFHICLATNYIKYFTNFSGVMILMLSSWLTDDQCHRLWERYISPNLREFLVGSVVLFSGLVITALGGFDNLLWLIFRYLIWLAYAVYIAVAFVRVVLCESPRADEKSIGTPHYALILLAFLNGLSPYLGTKTLSSFSMYSNLRVEPTYTNHLFMPNSLDLFGYLSDTIRVSSSTDPTHAQLVASPTERLPYLELCAYLDREQEKPPATRTTITYERNGLTRTTSQGDPIPTDCPRWLPRKLLRFQPVGDGAEKHCVW